MTRICNGHDKRASLRRGLRLPVLALMLALAAIVMVAARLPAAAAVDPDAQAVTELYERFVAAQNARDVPAVRALLSPSPTFQWVSDGKVFWGREVMLERMMLFQKSPVWRVEPDRQNRRFVRLNADAAYLYQPLTLVIGSETAPSKLLFHVDVMCVRVDGSWQIAGLFTTLQKSE